MTSPEVKSRLEKLLGYLAADPSNPHLIAELIPLALRAGQPEVAQAAVSAALKKAPQDAAVRFHAGTLALATAQPGLALELFSQLLADGEVHPAIQYNAAYAAFRNSEPARALELTEAIPAELESQVPELRKLQAQCLHFLERESEAVAKLLDYTAAVPDDAEGWGLLAMIAADDSQEDVVTVASARALALNPESTLAHLGLGTIALDAREADTALRHFSFVVEKHPFNGRAWSGLAFAQTLRLELAESERSFIKAVEFMPNHIGTWHGLAWLQILRKDLIGASHSLQKAMDIDHNFAETHGSVAVIAALEGRDADARFSMRRALGLNKDCASGLYAQTLLQAKKGEQHASMDELLAQISASMGMTEGNDLKSAVAKFVADLNSGKKSPTAKSPTRTLH